MNSNNCCYAFQIVNCATMPKDLWQSLAKDIAKEGTTMEQEWVIGS